MVSCSRGYLKTTAQPKSMILTIPNSLTQQLSNFKSRCARPISCKYRTPATICLKQHPISSSVCFPVITIANYNQHNSLGETYQIVTTILHDFEISSPLVDNVQGFNDVLMTENAPDSKLRIDFLCIFSLRFMFLSRTEFLDSKSRPIGCAFH